MKDKKKNQRNSRRKGNKRLENKWLLLVKNLIYILIFAILSLLLWFYMEYGEQAKSFVADGVEIADKIEIKDFKKNEGDGYLYKELDDMNPYLYKAVVSIEDERFESHNGIDYRSYGRVLWVAFKSMGEEIQGGSTITQQLARNIYLDFDVNLGRKLKEMIIAKRLEVKYSKEEIMEFYLNNINYGNDCIGIESASDFYFGRPTSELALSEIAFLTAIPNNPTLYNPLVSYDNTIKRKNVILNKMLEKGYINREEWEIAVNENPKPISKNY